MQKKFSEHTVKKKLNPEPVSNSKETLSYIEQLESKIQMLEKANSVLMMESDPEKISLLTETDPLSDGLFSLDQSWIITSYNPKASDLFQVGDDKLSGRNFISLVADNQIELVKSSLRLVLEGSPQIVRLNQVLANGDNRTIQLKCFPLIIHGVAEGVFCSAMDLSTSGKTEASLNRLVNQATELICRLDLSGSFLSVNPAFENVLGYSLSDLRNSKDQIKLILHTGDLESGRELLNGFMKGKTSEPFEIRHTSRSGDVKYIRWSVTPLLEEGEIYAIGRDITQQKKDVEFRNLVLESILDYFYALDQNFNFTYINRSAEEILNVESGSLIGKNIWEVFPVLKNSVFENHILTALSSKKPVNFEYYSEVIGDWFDESLYPSDDGVSVFFRSVSQRKAAEKELEDQKYFFEQTFFQSGFSTQLFDKEGWCLRINPKFTELFGVLPENIEGKLYSIFEDPEVIAKGIDKELREVIAQKKTKQWEVCYDIGVVAKALGIPVRESKQVWIFTTAYPIQNSVGEVTHLVVQHQDIGERIAHEKELLESETKYRTLIENINLGLLEVDTEDRIVKAHQKFCELVGYSEEELLGQIASEFLIPDFETHKMQEHHTSRLSGATENYEFSLLKKNGEVLNVIIVGTPIYNKSAEVTGSLGLYYNITDRKRAEMELVQQKELAETILGNIPIMIGIFDSEGTYQYVNLFWEEELGWDLEEMKRNGDIMSELYPDSDYRKRVLDSINSPGISWKDSITNSRSKGIIQTSWINVPLSDGRKIGIGQNITERKNAEKELQKSNERFEFVTKATFDAIWDSDLIENTTYWGEGFYTLFGYLPGALEEMQLSFVEFLHPQDRGRVAKSFHDAIDGTKQNWIDEYRFRTFSGTYAYVQDKAIFIRNDQGKAVRVIGAMQDITKQKTEEDRLKLLESVITNSSDSILIAEVNQKDPLKPGVVFVNAAFTRMTGFALDEIRGRTRILFKGANSDENEFARLNHAFLNRQPVEFEALNYRKNGEEFWVNLSLIPVSDRKGQCSHWISIQRDSTRRKKRELEREQMVNELTKSNKELKQFSFIISHNMRSPLTNLMAIVDLLDINQIQDEKNRQLLEGFKTSTQDLNSTLNDLVEILVIKENQNVDQTMVDFEEVNQKVQRSIHNLLVDSDALIHVNFSNVKSVMFNLAYMESIFLNMLTNSVKYAGKDRKPIIFIYSVATEDSVQLIFEDNGLGFNMAKVQSRIFGLYQKFHNYPDSKGIGLYLVHSQITSMGGTIEVESEENQGAKFIISFPLNP